MFYNPIQQYNRDLSVLAIKAFGDDLAAVRLAKKQGKSIGQETQKVADRREKQKQGMKEVR